MENVKCVVVGDGGAGKTCLLVSYSQDKFFGEYTPTIIDNYQVNLIHDDKPIALNLWDTAGQEDYDRLRPLSYPQADVFIAVFSLANKASLHNIVRKWIPEVQRYAPGVPIVLCGTKLDLRDSSGVQTEQGKEVQEQVGAAAYIEASAMTQHNVKGVFKEALDVAMDKKHLDQRPNKWSQHRRCSVM
jgi:Ras-related C3 botulinum toxin substrate 1